jgi:hypothetical protein
VAEKNKHDDVCFLMSKSPVLVGHACDLPACLTRVNARLFDINTDKPVTEFHDRKHRAVNTSIITCPSV